MKKFTLFLAVVSFVSMTLFSQESVFVLGDKALNLGIGFGSTLYTGSYYKSSVPPVSASFEMGVKDGVLEKGVIGVGGYVGYSSYKWEYLGWGWKYTDFIIGARGTLHYPLVDKLDTYTGIILGAEIVTTKEFGNTVPGYNYTAGGGGLAFSWFAGGRYYLTDNFAVMAELGYGITYLNLGIALKM